MKCKIFNPDIQTFALRFGPQDEIIRCTRADFNLNFDTHTITVNSDCGRFTAHYAESVDFVRQITNTSKSAFLDKISRRSEFDLCESKRLTIANLEKFWTSIADEYDDPEFALQLQKISIQQITAKNAKEFFYKVDSITGNLLEACQIVIAMDYPDSAKTIASVFEEYFKPVFEEKKQSKKV